MDELELTKLVREALADVDWSGHWPDQIDGRRVGEYVIGCDRTYPNWEGGSYIGSLYGSDGTVEYDIVFSGGQLNVFYADRDDDMEAHESEDDDLEIADEEQGEEEIDVQTSQTLDGMTEAEGVSY